MDMLAPESKFWLMGEILGKADWCEYVATLFPNDTRSVRCSDTLNSLVAVIEALPDTHPLFHKLEQMRHVDGNVRERWLDEIHLEFSYIGYLFAESTQQAIQRFIEITDASLMEWQQANRRH